jgi:hypothetical protein
VVGLPLPISSVWLATIRELARYTVEFEQHWAPLIEAAHTLTTAKFAESLISRTREFSQRRPAYFILRDAPIKVSRTAPARKILREAFVQAFRAKNRRFHTRKRFSLPTSSWKR